MQELRAGGIANTLRQHLLNQQISPAHGIANHDQVRFAGQMLHPITLIQQDSGTLQLGTHGGIDVLVTTRDTVAHLLGQHGKTAHESATNTEDIDVHCRP